MDLKLLDTNRMDGHFVHTIMGSGLTEQKAELAIQLLSREKS
jgi:hypothetical protein